MRTDARADGYGVRMRMHQDREQIGSILDPTQRDHGLMKEEEGVLGISDEATPTRRLLTYSYTPTHRHSELTSHLLGDNTDLMCV